MFYKWDGAAWDKVAMPYDYEGYFFDFIDSNCSQPSCYLSLQASNLAPGGRGNDSAPGSAPDDSAELTGRTSVGAGLWDIDALGRWSFLNLDYDFRLEGLPPFADGSDSGYPDCPFSAGGATGAGSADCVGSSPSYYETFQAADVDGVPGDELLARASDGLRVRKWVPGSSGGSWNLLDDADRARRRGVQCAGRALGVDPDRQRRRDRLERGAGPRSQRHGTPGVGL